MIAVLKVLSCLSPQFGPLLDFVLVVHRRLWFSFQRLHRERPGVRGVGAGLGANPGLVRVTPGDTQLIRRVDGGLTELGELVIVGGGRGWTGEVFSVSKVYTTDETENRSSKLDASFHNF